MRDYQTPRLVYSLFSKESIVTTSGDQKINLNEWLTEKGAEGSNNHVVVSVDMSE